MSYSHFPKWFPWFNDCQICEISAKPDDATGVTGRVGRLKIISGIKNKLRKAFQIREEIIQLTMGLLLVSLPEGEKSQSPLKGRKQLEFFQLFGQS